jgi:hypothetical protein
MAKTREKTLSYRRAEWLTDIPKGTTLESCLKAAHNVLKTVQQKTIIRDNGQQIRAVKKLAPRDGGFFLHVTADTPGEEASVVPKAQKDTEELDVGTVAAPDNAEFMDGDAFLYVRDDHVCICTTGMRDGAVRLFLYEFFAKARLGDWANKFDLFKAANVDKLRMLRTQGVKEIALKATLFQATTQYEKRKGTTGGLLRTLARHIQAIIQSEIEDFDDSLRVQVTIRTDGRVRKHLSLGERRIEKLAADVVEHEQANDDFEIITNYGQKVRPDEIFLSETMFIAAQGKSVKRPDAWDHLEKYYNRLRKAGALEQ